MIFLFSILASCLVSLLAPTLMGFFVPETAAEVIAVGAHYLRIEGSCYLGIGILFMLYGFYRAIKRAGMSVILGHPGGAGLLSFLLPGNRCHRHLALHSHRLGAGRYVWYHKGVQISELVS